MLPTFRLSVTYSLIYGLCKVVTCQTAAHTHLDATFHFEVSNESYYHTFRSAYFWNPTSGLRKILRTFRLSLAKSLLYGLWKMVTCLTAAHIHQDATFEFEVIDENDYDNSRSAYFSFKSYLWPTSYFTNTSFTCGEFPGLRPVEGGHVRCSIYHNATFHVDVSQETDWIY